MIESSYGRAVHVANGRRLHRALTAVRTLCGQVWVALIVGSPATEMSECNKCRHEMGLGPAPLRHEFTNTQPEHSGDDIKPRVTIYGKPSAELFGLCETCGAARRAWRVVTESGTELGMCCSADQNHGPDDVPEHSGQGR